MLALVFRILRPQRMMNWPCRFMSPVVSWNIMFPRACETYDGKNEVYDMRSTIWHNIRVRRLVFASRVDYKTVALGPILEITRNASAATRHRISPRILSEAWLPHRNCNRNIDFERRIRAENSLIGITTG
jgi:hypothetical protein